MKLRMKREAKSHFQAPIKKTKPSFFKCNQVCV